MRRRDADRSRSGTRCIDVQPGDPAHQILRASSCSESTAPSRALRTANLHDSAPGKLVTSARVPAPGRESPAACRLRYSAGTSSRHTPEHRILIVRDPHAAVAKRPANSPIRRSCADVRSTSEVHPMTVVKPGCFCGLRFDAAHW